MLYVDWLLDPPTYYCFCLFIVKQVQGHAYQNREEFLEHVRMMHGNSVVYNGMTPIILYFIWIESLLRRWCIRLWHKLTKRRSRLVTGVPAMPIWFRVQMRMLENWFTINFPIQLNNEIHATLHMRHKTPHNVCPLEPKSFFTVTWLPLRLGFVSKGHFLTSTQCRRNLIMSIQLDNPQKCRGGCVCDHEVRLRWDVQPTYKIIFHLQVKIMIFRKWRWKCCSFAKMPLRRWANYGYKFDIQLLSFSIFYLFFVIMRMRRELLIVCWREPNFDVNSLGNLAI